MLRFPRVTRAGAAVLAVCAALTPSIVPARPAGASSALIGGGSGFAALEIGQWTKDVARAPLNLSVNYSSQSSGVGRANFANKLFDFGASDIVYPPSSEQELLSSTTRCGKPLSSCFKYVPVSAGGLGFMYNLVDSSNNRVRDLRLTRDEVCKIFTGQIRDWGDPQLVATNPQLSSFHHAINPVLRDDSAGESYVLSEFCIAVDPAVWNAFKSDISHAPNGLSFAEDPGFTKGEPVSVWPKALPDGKGGVSPANVGAGSDVVANTVANPDNGPYSITYNAAGYAKVRDFPVASVENAAGMFTQPTETNVTVALAYATGRGDGTFILNFTGSDARAYFPSTYSYVLAQTAGFDSGKGATLSQFLCYAVGPGQVNAPVQAYARLSSEIVAISIAAINQIPGANCVLSGPPPPAPIAVTPGAAKTPTGSSAAASTPSGGTTGTTAAKGGTTGSTVTATVGGTPEASGTMANGAAPELGGGGNTAVTLSAVPTRASTPGPTNTEALWALVEGAAVCAIGLALAGARRGST